MSTPAGVPTKWALPVPDLQRLRQLAGPITPAQPVWSLRTDAVRRALRTAGFTSYGVGEVVDITIRGEVTVAYPGGRRLVVSYDSGDTAEQGGEVYLSAVPTRSPAVTISRVSPVDGPPRTGDVWVDTAGNPYLVTDDADWVSTTHDTSEIRWLSVHQGAAGPLLLVWRWPAGPGDADAVVQEEVARDADTGLDLSPETAGAGAEGSPAPAAIADAIVQPEAASTMDDRVKHHDDDVSRAGDPATDTSDRDADTKVWACPQNCGYHIVDGPVPDGEDPTDELIRRHMEEHADEQDWVFTFGHGQRAHAHGSRGPESEAEAGRGFQLLDRYVVIRGTYDTARDAMVRIFGPVWSFQYPSLEAAGVDDYDLTELVLTYSRAEAHA